MIYFNTSLKGIVISKTGSVKNSKSNQILKVSKRGYFSYYEKPVNLAKLMIQTFKGIKIRTGQICFNDGNHENFNIENIDYKTKLQKVTKPSESAIISIIKYYFGRNEEINFKDVFKYRMQLKVILDQRNFFYTHKKTLNINVFKDYFSMYNPGLMDLSKRNNITVNDAKRTVYFFLNKLIKDCISDKIIKQ